VISIDAGSRPRVAGHLLEFDDFDGQVAARRRNPAVAVADGTPGAMWKSAAAMDGRMGLLHRLRPRHHRVETMNSPCYSAFDFVQISFIASMLSRTRLKRVAYTVPWFSGSSWFQPPPMPNRKRPLLTWSIEATSFGV
jgi:hypothetical protein